MRSFIEKLTQFGEWKKSIFFTFTQRLPKRQLMQQYSRTAFFLNDTFLSSLLSRLAIFFCQTPDQGFFLPAIINVKMTRI
jgi:hypothetical protein